MADIAIWQDKKARQAFVARGKAAFAQINEELDGVDGVVAIEPESGDYFVGATLGQANNAARQKYLDHWLYFARLDNPDAAMPLPTW